MVNPTIQSINPDGGKIPPHPVVIADDPQVIRAQIERTRAQMGHTLDEIQVRLSPDYIRQQTQDSIREATVEKVEKMAQTAEHTVNNWRSNAIHTMKENPVPTALIGLGIGWLLLSDKNGRDEVVEGYPERYYGHAGYTEPYGPGGSYYYRRENESDSGTLAEVQARAGESVENAQEWIGETSDRAQQKAQKVAATVQHQASSAAEAVRENVSEVTSNAQQYASETAEQARQRAAQARRQVRRAKRTFWQTMEENPLAIGIAAAAAGALIGMALPSTEKENKLMGQTRDRLVQDATSTAQETLHKVQAVAETTAKTAVTEAKIEAEKQNLPTPAMAMSEKADGQNNR